MKTLTQRFTEILEEMDKRKADIETTNLFLINAVREYNKEVLGEIKPSKDALDELYYTGKKHVKELQERLI